VAGIVGEMADSGSAQSASIVQISQAIGQIDASTQQNAALVEQVAAAAQSLQGQSGQLHGSVKAFQVEG
jgi:methyl-accepting chemotaxis protein